MDTLLWIVAIALIVTGIAGTVLPVLPGTALVFAGMLLGAWIDGFTRVSGLTLVLLGLLALLAWGVDYVAGVLGARRAGASRQALIGAAVGTAAGLLLGIVGVLFLPLAGAALGEWLAQRDERRALRVGVATWIGLLLGMAAKVGIAFVMVGVFVAAWLW